MRLGTIEGRASLIDADTFIDIAEASDGAFSADPMELYARWDELVAWAPGADRSAARPITHANLGCPVPAPRQVFALAVNYRDHAAEASIEPPANPLVFTKFPSCISGPYDDVPLSTNRADWEVELVVVLAREARNVDEADAWAAVAGVTVGQDISERRLQFRKPFPHLSLAKSLPGFGPIGPFVVSTDEFPDPDALRLSCSINGETVQDARTSDLIFSVPRLVSEISAFVRMLPGDLIFTGTPSGTGSTRDPRRYLEPGDVIESTVDGIGTMRNVCMAEI